MSVSYDLTKGYSVTCDFKKPFTHVAVIYDNKYNRLNRASKSYLNRTWERYEYQSVIHKAIEDCPDLKQKTRAKNKVDNQALGKVEKDLAFVGAVATLGEIFGDTDKAKNDWKKRMLKAGLGDKGLTFPEDWDTLTEEEKTKRLDGAINIIS